MFTSLIRKHAGFTLVEMMIVLFIIMILFSLVLFPYSYYMERSYVSRTLDTVWQEWLLAHKSVRNGKIFSGTTNAHIMLIFRKWSNSIESYLMSWSTFTTLSDFSPGTNSPRIRENRTLHFDNAIEILDFSGATWVDGKNILGYLIEPPYGSGKFIVDGTPPAAFSGTIKITLGYTGATLESFRAQNILLSSFMNH
jgi:prepilin-type N-terminal cleavage/methylation domain-containing protein